MNRQSIHQQIESLLKTIQEQHSQIKQHPQSIPQVEIDFMIQNLRQLYEAAWLLNHTNALSSLDEVKAAMAQKILAEKRAIEMKQNETKPEPKKEIVQEPVIMQEVKKTETVEPEHIVTVTKEEIEITVVEEKSKEKISRSRKSDLNSSHFEDKPTLGDQFGNGESLHVKIASKTSSKTVADNLHHKPIRDLKSAIGINEKFLFINQLFEGNFQRYSEVIDKINSLSDFESAKQLISTDLNWEDTNEHVKTFMELVERRFI